VDLHVDAFDRSRHDRGGFTCGEPALDEYLARQATQDVRRDLAALFCLLDGDDPSILGYYTLSASSIQIGDLPDDLVRGLPGYADVPAVLLCRLAVRRDRQGARLGQTLLLDAFKRSLSGPVAVWCVAVDALNEAVAQWYRRYDLLVLPHQPLRLVIPAKTIRTLLRPGR
jgi:hypothetical protein